MVSKLPIVGVMGSGRRGYPQLARPLGELVARLGCHLLTGGGGGVMAEVARAFTAVEGRAGLSIGVLRSRESPRLDDRGRRRYASAGVNEWVEVAIATHLHLSSEAPESRNHINVLSADFLVALPGSSGTLSEVRLRLQYGRPLIVFLGDPAEGRTIGGRSAGQLAAEAVPGEVRVAETVEEVEGYLSRRASTAGSGAPPRDLPPSWRP